MLKLIKPFFMLVIAGAVLIGATYSYFNDTEGSIGNTFTSGTIDISVNSQSPWTQKFTWADAMPGDEKLTTLHIVNTGENEAKIWKKVYNFVNDENGISEPEQEWYDDENGGNPKNDLETVIRYELKVNGESVVPKESDIPMNDIKEGYMYLGILDPNQAMDVDENYHIATSTTNWAQTDSLKFDIEILAVQTDAPDPTMAFEFLENKNLSTWNPVKDARFGILKYTPINPTFDYSYLGYGLTPGTDYCLIYYADGWPGNHPGYFFSSQVADAKGKVALNGSADLGFSLPHPLDVNSLPGDPQAKIWLVECSTYDKPAKSIIGWNAAGYSFEYWPIGINYSTGTPVYYENTAIIPETIETKQIVINDIGATTGQYGYDYDYASTTVEFTYDTPATGTLAGLITATGLKPYATYQVKFEGKPTCLYGPGGDDTANEVIGYRGRWWDNTINANVTDADYETNSIYKGGTHCITGYLVWDHFTADSSGNASKALDSDNSYHVLRCGGGVCGTISDALLSTPDALHPLVKFCTASDVNGELERALSYPCGGLTLPSGDYGIKIGLTEESFHTGPWATVLTKDIVFKIN